MTSIVLIFSLTFSTVALTQENAPLKKLAVDYEQTKKTILDKDEQQRKVMSVLFSINRSMKKLVTDQGNLVQQRMGLEASTQELAERIRPLEEKTRLQKNRLRERLVAIYKMGGQGVARFIFSSTNSAQLDKNLKILGSIAKHDLDLIKDYSASMRELETKKQKLQKRLAKLKKLESKIQEKEKALSSETETKNKVLNHIRQSQQFSMNKLSTLREKTAKLEGVEDSGVLDLLFRPAFFEKKGDLPMPVAGAIVQKFGIVRDEQHNVSWSQKGILISAPSESEVHSVFDGSVAFTGNVEGFGPTVIVDHGDHYYTVYGANHEIRVKEGQEIKQNQVIARSGRHPETGTDGVYFEIRHFSEPYDPKTWLKGSSL